VNGKKRKASDYIDKLKKGGTKVNPEKLIGLLSGSPKRSIDELISSGVKFTKAYVHFRNIGRSYMNSGSGKTWTYSLFGTDPKGNSLIYDKYEGGTAGGGQSWIFVNGKKRKASDYIDKLKKGVYFDAFENAGIPVHNVWVRSGTIDAYLDLVNRVQDKDRIYNDAKSKLSKLRSEFDKIGTLAPPYYLYVQLHPPTQFSIHIANGTPPNHGEDYQDIVKF
jgi:hypothetical protein